MKIEDLRRVLRKAPEPLPLKSNSSVAPEDCYMVFHLAVEMVNEISDYVWRERYRDWAGAAGWPLSVSILYGRGFADGASLSSGGRSAKVIRLEQSGGGVVSYAVPLWNELKQISLDCEDKGGK